jgi:hypothetical protein
MLNALTPFETEPTRLDLPSGRSVDVPTYAPRFARWTGDPPPDIYWTKAVFAHEGQPLFAELIIRRLFESEGWEAVWVDSFKSRFLRGMPILVEPCTVPQLQERLLGLLSGGKRFPSGCWDVFAWRGDTVAFAEAKRSKRDRPNANQCRWLDAALSNGISLSQFMFVEWDIDEAAPA